MHPEHPVAPASSSRRSPLSLFLVWLAAQAIAGFIIGALEGGGFQFMATLFFTGPILGVAQWLVLRRYFPGLRWWAVVTTAGWIGGVYLGLIPTSIITPFTQDATWPYVLRDALQLGIMSLTQFFMLKPLGRRAGWWIPTNIIGGIIQRQAGIAVCAAVCRPVLTDVGGSIATGVSYAGGWLGYGLVTGLFLVWLWRDRPSNAQ